MKKIMMIAAFAAMAMTANAQVWMGGSLGADFVKVDGADNTSSVISVKPEIGYSINDKWDVAIGLGAKFYNDASFQWEGLPGNGDATEWTIAPYARYTFAQTGKVGFFVDGGVDLGIMKPKDVDSKTSVWVGLRPGIKFAASDKITLVAHLGSLGYKNVKDTYSQYGLNIDNNGLSLGLYWSF